MVGQLILIWDYDGAVGRINASYPYYFKESNLLIEIENVEEILELAETYNIRMTFACTGFSAEPGAYPYHIPEQIARIREAGHEVASHSWKHEWFPFLERKQIELSLEKSKQVLEQVIGELNGVTGFAPPFSRPMSWYSRGAISLGDRVFGPRFPGANLGSLIRIAGSKGYRWIRVSYRPVWNRLFTGSTDSYQLKKVIKVGEMVCLPQHYVGFGDVALRMLDRAVAEQKPFIVSAHPAALDWGRNESRESLKGFLEYAAQLQNSGSLITMTPRDIVVR